MSDVVATGVLQIQAQIDTAQLNQALSNTTTQITANASKAATNIQSNFDKSFKNVIASGKSLTDSLSKGITNVLGDISTGFKLFGAAAVTSIAAVTAEAIDLGVHLNELEAQSKISFTSLTGSATVANALLEVVNKTAEENPFLSKDVFLASAKNLLAVGVAAKNVGPDLQAIADAVGATGGNEGTFSSLVSLITRIQETGKVSSRVLIQLSHDSIDAAAIVAKELGKTQDQVRAQVSNGTITGKQFSDALLKGFVDNFGPFKDEITKTLPGAVSVFKNSLAELGATLTSAFVNPAGGGAAITLFNDLGAIINHVREVATPLLPVIQGIADGFAGAADSVTKFISGIKIDQVQSFVDSITKLAPALLAVGSAFGASQISKIATEIVPALGEFLPILGELDPVVAAIVAFGVALPPVRDAIVQIGEALLTAFRPAADIIVPAVESIIEIVQKLVAQFSSGFGAGFVSGLEALAPVIKAAATGIADLLGFAGEILKILGPLAPVIGAIAGAFAVAAVAAKGFAIAQGILETVTATLTGVFQGAAVGIAEFVTVEEGASVATGVLEAALGGLEAILSVLLGPIGIITGALILYNKITGDAKDKTDKLFAAQTQGLGTSLADQMTKVAIAQKDATEAAQKEADARGGIVNQVKALNPLTALHQIAAKKAREEADKNLKAAQDLLDVTKQQATVEQEAGIAGANAILQSAQEVAAGVQQNIDAALKPLNEMITDENAIREAKVRVADAQFQLNDLERQRNLLLHNVAAQENEIAQAKFKVLDADTAIRDLEQSRAEAVRTEQERQQKFAEDQAAFGDKVLQNQIEQRKAAQDLVDAQRQLQFLQRQQNFGPQGLNLAGLSIAEARRRISAATTTLQNQQTNIQQGTLARQIAEQTDAVTSAQIKQRDAARQSVDLQISNGDAIHANDIALRNFAQDTDKFNEDLAKAQLASKVAVEEQGNLLSGQIGTQQTLLGLNHQIATAQRGLTDAQNQQKIAQDTLNVFVATQSGITDKIVAANKQLIDDKVKQAAPDGPDAALLDLYTKQKGILDDIVSDQAKITDNNKKGILSDLNNELEDLTNKVRNPFVTSPAAKAAELPALVSTLQELRPLIVNKNNQQVGAALSDDQITKFATDALTDFLKDPSSNINQILRAILANAGLSIPGFAKGGLVTSEQLVRVGEQNRMEAILPLTKPANLQNLLSQPEILNPILAALPRIKMPSGMDAAKLSASMDSIYGSGGSLNANARIDQEASEDRMARKIARALADEMQQRQLGNVKIDAPVTVSPHRLQNPDDIAKSVAREIIRKLR